MTNPTPYPPQQPQQPWGPPPRPPQRPPSNRTRNIVLSVVAAVTVAVVVTVVVILTSGGGSNGDTNARGSVPVKIGEPVTLDSGAIMTVTKIEVDPPCGEEQADPDDHVVAVSISAETPTSMDYDYWSPSQGGAVWAVIDDDGKTVTDQAGFPYAPGCSDDEIPGLGRGQSGEGLVLLSVPVTSGTLIFHERFAPTEHYEWTF